MNIAFFYLGQQGGGAALDTMELAKGLSNFADVLCVISSSSDSYYRWVEESKVNSRFKVLGIKTSKKYIKALLFFLNFLRNRKLISAINQFQPQVVFSHMGHPYEKAIIPYIRCKIKAKGIHDVVIHEGERSLYYKFAQHFDYDATHYVVFSNFSCAELIRKGIARDKILITFLGCNSTLIRNRVFDDCNYNRFLFFGRLIKYKGIDVLFDSLDQVFKKHPDCKLVIAGRGDISEYNNLILKYSNNIEIHNEWIADEDVHLYFKNIDFVVAPYTNATQSGVVLLAYSFGKPVIASNNGGLPEQVKEGDTGIIIQTGDPMSLANAINSMLDNNDRLLKMKRNAYECFDELSWDSAAQKLFEEFVRCL